MTLIDYLGCKPYPVASSLGVFSLGDAVGIEVELENMPIPYDPLRKLFIIPAPEGWEFKMDGSLRNNGIEFVFQNPIGGLGITRRLTALQAFLKDWAPDASTRTSVHVHIDALHCSQADLLKWLMVYIVFEKILFEAYAPERLRSNFCVPLGDSNDSICMIELLKKTGWDKFMSHSKNRGETKRYSAVNLDAVRRYGSLEFRHLSGTTDINLISRWTQTLMCLKAWAMNPRNGFDNFFHGPSRGYSEEVTRSIFGWSLSETLTFVPRFNELYIEGVRAAQLFAMNENVPKVPESFKEKLKILRKEKIKRNQSKLRLFIKEFDVKAHSVSKNFYLPSYSRGLVSSGEWTIPTADDAVLDEVGAIQQATRITQAVEPREFRDARPRRRRTAVPMDFETRARPVAAAVPNPFVEQIRRFR